ncbi:hypothetical protein A2715_04845 [Candidatus Woesebacteria bacterium RIFCSPHIGHO2_01_FULL_39_32]|uniref:TVP38/TMEM64 family membrane protein n=1 Tax=Candidatus Woesebacteria bacterium RIFCSPLOWO2_01_FULL_39_25 TaxID=1802521 RepID=A0A1F8BLD0_9BACT|nr:MAG: hypothetical protein A2124_00870 [Candidatus Woesebacteria bacterium GWB1_37_5]OGM25346.1 MAG: hypothetical protein A2715_04845 [Candidatus Woesebacteria bacterium RIFCSPHIGHO2_01_FULL_39_32]OGM37845.1 MAG: hypothetical protein A3F01_02055 [Candidatus Woesebacteria bacterium RIFCSPHIGHO2_12_FULL_38_11]OGM64877.1 MAG: hypothetical protein A2893_04455 [Candidatus Woesebacteria bacterium RIFCSPLOWO2_01_FULL_39_25]
MLEVLTYIFVVSLSTAIPPFVAVPLELAAPSKFGLPLAFIYTLFGNIVGATAGFLIARKYGWVVIERVFHEHHVTRAKSIAKKYTFWKMTWTRMFLVSLFDVLSWAAGLTTISLGRFILSTVISNIPVVTVILVFGNSINISYAMMGWMSVGVLIISVYVLYKALRLRSVPEEATEKNAL